MNAKLQKRLREIRIINNIRLRVECPDCGAERGKECKPDYGCDDVTRAEHFIKTLDKLIDDAIGSVE